MDCIGFVIPFAKCILVHVIPAFHYQSAVDELNNRFEEFCTIKKHLQDQVAAANCYGDIISDDAKKWVTDAVSLSQVVEEFRNNERERANLRFFHVSFPNLVGRNWLSEKAKELAGRLETIVKASHLITQVSTHRALQTSLEMKGDFMDFQSRKETLERIMDALKNPEVSRIGVWGMAGIGKTMLAKEVAKRATNETLFSEVAMAIVSKDPDIQKIQRDIAEKLRLTSVNEVQSIPERAHRLQCQLEEKKDILIILDDIWERLDLGQVGISFGLDQKGCKILLTSRDKDCVLEADEHFQIEELSSDESTDLFNKVVGDTLLGRPDLKERATEVVTECCGLPITITTVASALRKKKDLHRWDDALQQLRSSTLKSIPGMSKDVYKSIKLNYDSLEEDGRQLLLLCSLHEENMDIAVEDLMRYCVGWGLFSKDKGYRKLEDARTRVHTLVDILKDRSLLLDGDDYGRVKMHNVIRDVAISISSEDERGMRSVMFDELKDCMKRTLNNSIAISVLEGYNPAQLPEKLECPRLELLLFMPWNCDFNYDSTFISADFFAESKELKTLSWLPSIESMPSSFLSLQSLQTLCLRDSNLKDVDFIGDLKNLIILDLSNSSVKRLSRKMGQLTNLQLLDLQGCQHLEVIEPNAIRNLTRLEELYMAETFQGWEVGEDGIGERRNASLIELKNLRQLTVLYLKVKDAKILPGELFRKKLNRYRISIGFEYSMHVGEGISRSLHLKFNQWSRLIEFGTEWLIKGCEELLVEGLMGIHNAFPDLDSEGFSQLGHLNFSDNDEVQYILGSVDHIEPCHAFPSLNSLVLTKLENLERICQGKPTLDSFNNLTVVDVHSCHRLKNLLPLSIVKRLLSIRVQACEMMEEIVTPGRQLDAHSVSNNEGGHEVESFELRLLDLSTLPKFVQFCSCELEATCGSSSPIDSPKPLFSKKVSFPNLEYLNLWRMTVENLLSEELKANSYMKNLTTLVVYDCNNLRYLFSFGVGERLVNLKDLRVDHCTAMQDIIVTKREEGIGLKGILFPKLEYLTLRELPALKRFCAAKSCIEFPSLLQLQMGDCPKLKTFVMPIQVSIDNEEVNLHLFNEKVVSFPYLKDLFLMRIRAENLLPEELKANSYLKNLTSLEVRSCHNLRYLFSFAASETLVNLEELRIEDCMAMEDIVVTKREEGIGPKNVLFPFPKLKDLRLIELPALKRICAAESSIKYRSFPKPDIINCPELKTFIMPI